MKRPIAALMLTLLFTAGTASALQTKDIVALAAMPLAVAAVSEMTDVPTSDLVNVVTAMNRAAVPAPQFVEIVRYTPVALVHDTMQPRFVTYATTQYQNGIYGDAYAVSLADRLRLYGADQVNVVRPVAYTPAYVVERQYVPAAYVVTPVDTYAQLGYGQYGSNPYGSSPYGYNQYGYGQNIDPVALVAMPLAVAAVANLAGIPTNDLFSLIGSLNQAYVPAPQFVEIVRYSPVVFLDNDPQFVTYVRREVDRGVVRTALVRSIQDRYRNVYDLRDVDVVRPRPVRRIVERNEYIPPVVISRIERSAHSFGGPPGRLKKERGYQTGAEVVHGTRPGSDLTTRVAGSSRPVVERERQTRHDKRSTVARENRREVDRSPARVERPQRGASEHVKPNKQRASGKGKSKGQASLMRQSPERGAAVMERGGSRKSRSVASPRGGKAGAHGRAAKQSKDHGGGNGKGKRKG